MHRVVGSFKGITDLTAIWDKIDLFLFKFLIDHISSFLGVYNSSFHMQLASIDWFIIAGFLVLSLAIGISASKKSSKNSSEFFLSGRTMPWWLLGMSMVATTFSTDTPNLVTDLVRQGGVAGNWAWWAFLITGMLTVFIYAKLWRKSNVSTDIEFYELRYGGKSASFLRGFRAIYLGIAFNVLSMAGVMLAAIKIGEIMLGLSPIQTIGIASLVTVAFSALGGFRGVILTDFVLFFTAMGGSIAAAYYSVNLPEVGGISGLFNHELVVDKLSIIPSIDDKTTFMSILIIPIAVQWWSSWYPGAEPGGGGYIAQRMLAAKNEKHAMGATLFFNVAHYALRPWPWIIVALASLIVYPDLESIHEAFPSVSDDKLGHDLAYPAMLTFLPTGIIGLVMASLIAAFMSTISTHLNWGSSYIVYDFYKRFMNKDASEKELVAVGRISTVIMMVLAAVLALSFKNAKSLFDTIILFGAGTGLIFILRWFWWRINAWSEIVAMISSGVVALLLQVDAINSLIPEWLNLPLGVLITTIIWLGATFSTKPESDETLRNFYKKIQPGGPGWKLVINKAKNEGLELVAPNAGVWDVPKGIMATVAGCFFVYSTLFATGYWLYGKVILAVILTLIAILALWALWKIWPKISQNEGLLVDNNESES